MERDAGWQPELDELTRIALECGLTEEVKWGQPCFTFDGGNVLILGSLKDACVASFLKGVLLEDPGGLLIKPGENSRSGRYLRFTSVDEIREREPVMKAFIAQAIENEKAGVKVDFEKDAELAIPEELQAKLDDDPALKAAFEALTPGRRRGYVIYFAGAKQSKTRASRIDRHRERILAGKGMHDR